MGQYRNFINFNNLVPVAEYAVESDLMKFEYLKRVNKIVVDIDYEDYFFDPSLKGFRENIYSQTNHLKEIRTEREL